MGTMLKAALVAAFVAALALATGCEDTPITAGKNFTMNLVASPTTLDFPANATDPQTSSISAIIINDTGVAQGGISVLFTTSSAKFLSGTTEVNDITAKTDANGKATATLIVRADNPESAITVTATSAALSKTVKVTVTSADCSLNANPTAVITPGAAQTLPAGAVGTNVNATPVSGALSSDPESPTVTFAWTCFDGGPVITTSSVTCQYTYTSAAQVETIKLVVTDLGLPGHPECAASSQATVTVNIPAGTP